MRVIRKIRTAAIKIDRVPLDAKTLSFVDAMRQGHVFPPIKVAVTPNGQFEIRDGRHRWAASRLLQHLEITVRYGVSLPV